MLACLVVSVLCLAFLSLSGCVTMTPEQQARLQADANQKITCMKGSDCDMKWGRAVAWISQNSHWKIQMQSDHLIQTYTAVGNSSYSGFLVNKVPIDTDTFEIVMSSGCANMFGCIPDATTLRAKFNNFIIGPMPAVATVTSQQKPQPQ
jgi:hypothetical protein